MISELQKMREKREKTAKETWCVAQRHSDCLACVMPGIPSLNS